jgi:hypothetical protein
MKCNRSRRRPRVSAGIRARSIVPAAIVAGLVFLAATTSRADERPGISSRSGVIWRSWDLQKQTITSLTQWRMPYVVSVRLANRVDLVLSTAYAHTTFETDRSYASFRNGVTDTAAHLFVRLAGNRVVVQAGAQLPQGSAMLDSTEIAVADILAHPLLSFRSRQFSRGLDGHVGLALMTPLGRGVRAGISLGQSIRGAYTLFDQGSSYEPAAESVMAMGLELAGPEGSGNVLRVDAVGRMYGRDRQDRADVFAAGNQAELQLLARVGAGKTRSLEGSAQFVRRDNDRVFSQGPTEPQEYTPGTWIHGQASFRNRLARTLWIGLAGEWTHMQGNDRPGQDGEAYGGGPVVTVRLLGSDLVLGASYLGGTLKGSPDAGSTDLRGRQVSAQIVWRGTQ